MTQTVDVDTGEIVDDAPRSITMLPPVAELALMKQNELVALTETVDAITRATLNELAPQEAALRVKLLRDFEEIIVPKIHDRQAKIEAHNNLVAATWRTELWIGKWLVKTPKNGGRAGMGRPSLGSSAAEEPKDQPPKLSDYYITHKQSSRWQKRALKYGDRSDEWIDETKLDAQERAWKLNDVDIDGIGTQPMQGSDAVEWYTPRQYIEAARRVMGSIDTDPASNDFANKTVKAATYYTAQNSGLDQDWFGNVWLNPPYGGIAAEFIAHLLQQYEDGNVKQAVVLVNANSTDTQWFQPLFDHFLCFTNHRIDFTSPDQKDTTSTHGSCFIYLGTQGAEFACVFSKFGNVVQRWQS